MTIIAEQFRGVWSAAPTPFTEDLQIDRDAVCRMVEHHLRLGVKGLFLLGTCGEGPWMTDQQKRILVETVVAANRKRMLIAAQVTDNSAARILDNMALVQKAGADIAIIAPPFFAVNPTPENLTRLYLEAIRNCPLPVGIYARIGGGVSIPMETYAACYAEEKVILVKDSTCSPEHRDLALKMRRQRANLNLLNGNEFDCVSYLEAGYDGLLLGGGVFNGYMASHIIQAVQDHQPAQARDLQTRMNHMMHEVFGGEDNACWLSGQKHLLVKMGLFSTIRGFLNFPLTDSCRQAIASVIEREHDMLFPTAPKPATSPSSSSQACSLEGLQSFYQAELTENIAPFWLEHARDTTHGGYFTSLDDNGTVYDSDKICMWGQGRIAWTFGHLYNECEPRKEWLEMARHGVDFILKHGFAPDGTMYYSLTQDGQPLEPSRDIYTELSTVLGLTEFARAANDETVYIRARKLFREVWDRFQVPGQARQPFLAETRPVRLHGHSMITLNVLQELRRFRVEPDDGTMIDTCIDIMLSKHLKRDSHALLELVDWEGNLLPGSDGRWINPGHMIEGGSFLIHEGQYRQDQSLIDTGTDLIRWGFEKGWDPEYGGIFNDVDAEGRPINAMRAVVADTKLWWQHAEALYGLLLAYAVSGDDWFRHAYWQTHNYSFSRFADPDGPEWFALLDRCGRPINRCKGTERKNCFHIGRNFNLCRKLLSQPESFVKPLD